MCNSDKIKAFRSMAGKIQGFRTTTGYLFTDGNISLEVFRASNVVSVFRGDAVLLG